MTEFYFPGSKMQRKDHGITPEPSHEEEIDLGKPKQYSVGDKILKFYPISALALALNRSTITVRKWETDGTIPLPRFVLPGANANGKRRLYTEAQIMGLRKIAAEEGILYPSSNNKWAAVDSTRFAERALELWRELG